jgi:hypothetical protein
MLCILYELKTLIPIQIYQESMGGISGSLMSQMSVKSIK